VQNPVTKRGGIRRTIKIWQGLVWHVNCFLTQRDGTKKAFGCKFYVYMKCYKMCTKIQRKRYSDKTFMSHVFIVNKICSPNLSLFPSRTLALTVVILPRIKCSMVPVRGASSNWTTPDISCQPTKAHCSKLSLFLKLADLFGWVLVNQKIQEIRHLISNVNWCYS